MLVVVKVRLFPLLAALAGYAASALLPAPAVPEAAVRNPAYVSDHKIVPPSIMGIRG